MPYGDVRDYFHVGAIGYGGAGVRLAWGGELEGYDLVKLHAVYERIVIEGPRFVGLRLTPAAYRHGLALALPEAVMARPTGVGRALATYDIPIEGRDEWLAAARVRSA
jgi:hypothetical protein